MLESFSLKHNQNKIDLYFKARKEKYLKNINEITNIDNCYFYAWLSGFIEAKGCFSIRKTSNKHSFSIELTEDQYILDKIKSQFNITNKVRTIKNRNRIIEIYSKITILKIINHCIEYPLLGEKLISMNKFRNIFIF